MSDVDFHEGRRLYREAERDWEFHDSSDAFYALARWIDGNFEDLLDAAESNPSASAGK